MKMLKTLTPTFDKYNTTSGDQVNFVETLHGFVV